ncbi:MAG: beta strand repeat-containing protein, partial [Chthoniobacterales bacterium]
TYTGTTTVRAGTVNVASLNSVVGGTASSSLGAPTTALNGTISMGSGSSSANLNYTGPGETTDRVLDFSGTTGTMTISNSGTGALNFSSAPTFSGAGNKTVALGAATDSIGGSIGPIANGVSGTVGVLKNGLTNSTWTLNGLQTYTGNTTVSGGVLQIASTASLTNSYITLTGAAATRLAVLQTQGTLNRTMSGTAAATNLNWGTFAGFAAKGGSLTLTMTVGAIPNGQLTWGSGNFMGAGTDPIVFGSTTSDNLVEFTNPVNMNTADAFSRVWTVNGAPATIAGGTTGFGFSGSRALASGVLSGGIQTGSATGLTKNGTGTLILSGLNTYQGGTLISAGTLVAGTNVPAAIGGVGQPGAFGTGAGSIATPGTTFYTIGLGDGNTTTNNSSPTLLIGGAFTVERPVTINNNATTGTYGLGGSTDNVSTFSGVITANRSFSITQAATTGGNALNITGGISGASAGIKTVTFANVGAVNVSTGIIMDGTGGGKIALAQTGSGTTTLSGLNLFTGTTTVSGGKLVAASLFGPALSGTTSVAISGGTLQLGQDEQINDAATLTLSGGTFDTAGFSETLNTLTLNGTAVLDLGGAASILHFADSSAIAWTGTLSIYNWSGSLDGGGTDQIYFGFTDTTLTAQQLASINIYSDAGSTFVGNGGLLASGELIAVPEPQVIALLLGGILVTAASIRRSRKQPSA